ncbi:hypothetical protein ABZ297_16650 [Nonomuraea sp. NPDC005983]|uniref:hypothetical protein n=1 Tax=Nonomuraea sp. NPDC005983 TaxID=3155595 RepID=UPI00339F5FED
MSPEQPHTPAVFVDQSGRRRRLIMVGSIMSSVLTLTVLAVLIGGAFSGTKLSVNGWPGDRPGAVGATASPDRSATARTSPSGRPTPTPTRTTARPTPSEPAKSAEPTSAEPTTSAVPPHEPAPRRTTPSRRPSPTVRPSTPEPSEEPTAEPTPEPTENGDQPPGAHRTPPGLDPNRTKGPKK